jgi:hypothetical protein
MSLKWNYWEGIYQEQEFLDDVVIIILFLLSSRISTIIAYYNSQSGKESDEK